MSRTLAAILSESEADRVQRGLNLKWSSVTTDLVPIHSEKHRMGAPFPLPYLPLKETQVAPANTVKQVWTSLEREIDQILTRNNVDEERHISLTYRQSEEDFGSARGLTVLVLADHAETDRWCIVDSIRALLLTYEFNGVVTEIIDPFLLRRLVLYPIFSSHPMAEGWNTVKEPILEVLRAENVDWQCINVLRIGTAGDPNPPAVIHITASISTRLRVLDQAEEKIKAICTEKGLAVHTEMTYGEIWGYSADPGTPKFVEADPDGDDRQKRNFAQHGWYLGDSEYTNRPRMGLSIGADKLENDDKGARGTLGGYLELVNKKGASKLVALTCWHVIWYGMEKGDTRNKIDENGIVDSDATRKVLEKIRVRQPAPQDHKETIDFFEANAHRAKRQANEGDDRYRKAARQQLRDLQAKIGKLNNFFRTNSGFGRLYAASGFNPRLRIDNHRANWALLELTKDRGGKNILPEAKDYAKHGSTHEMAKPYTFGQRLTSIGSLGEVNDDDPVFMRGRTSGVGAGQFNGIKSVIRLRDDPAGPPSEERAYLSFGTYPAFAKPGDSGAMVWNDCGQWVGLVMAGAVITKHNDKGDMQGLVYLQEANSIKTQIEDMTGMSVRLPRDGS